MEELMVFDLQRFALHDGPGIRTTVFLKGCPLDCAWCHNPESKKSAPQLRFLEKKCTGCGRCEEVCRYGVHKVKGRKSHNIEFSKCVQCGSCVKVCVNNAIKFYGNKMTSREILEIVLKDRDFYQRSNGGLTVSGGEPMMQFKGLLELLKKAKEEGVPVCLDTSGQASTEKYAEIAEYVDLFLYDYKITGAKKHKQYTGVENHLILKNLEYLCGCGSNVYLRCPIIPGVNDNDTHYKAIADLSKKYHNIREVNLMMYHDMAKSKADEIGEDYQFSYLKSIEKLEKVDIYSKVQSFGCLNLKES